MTKLCHDCGVPEGALHEPGCDMERCPFCGHQLISCDCCYEKLGIFDRRKYTSRTHYLSPEVYEHGLSDEQMQKWEAILEAKGRVPYIVYPLICARCGTLWPEFFRVSNEEWAHYIEIGERDKILCRPCYDAIKALIDGEKEKIGESEDA